MDIKSISQLFNQIIVSIDGSSPEINDFHRGVGTFEKAFRTVAHLREHKANVQIAVVVTRINANDIFLIRSLFEPMGASVKFQPVYSLGRAIARDDILIDGEDYFHALSRGNRDGTVSLFNRPLEPGVRTTSCGVGGSTLSIDSDGAIYPCHLLHKQEYSFGKLTDSSFIDIWGRIIKSRWYKFSVDDIRECRHCFLRYICAGNCRARALYGTGSLYSPDPFCCYFKKATLECLFNSGWWVDGSSRTMSSDINCSV